MPTEEQILVLAPLGRDAEVVRQLLTKAGFDSRACTGLDDLRRSVVAVLGAILVTEEALTADSRRLLLQLLEQQPVWSDLPVLLLLSSTAAADPRDWMAVQAILPARNVTILRRPVPSATLVSVLKSVLQARRRQYEVRKHLEARERQAAELEKRVVERTRQIRELASQLTIAEHEERHRISQILHDDLQQQLYSIRIQLSFLPGASKTAELSEQMAKLEEAVELAIETTRQLSADLSPAILRGEGLTEGLQWIARRMKEQHGLTVELEAEESFPIASHGRRVVLFQVMRELLFNAVKHAGVARVAVSLRQMGDQAQINVVDEGNGFDPDKVLANQGLPAGQGLLNVRERLHLIGGQMEIESAPGQGTRIEIVLPAEE